MTIIKLATCLSLSLAGLSAIPMANRPLSLAPALVVLLPTDPCRCAVRHTIAVTLASGNCTPTGGSQTACFTYTTTSPSGASPTAHGRCYKDPTCPNTTPASCVFNGYDVHLFAATCAAQCSEGGSSTFSVWLDAQELGTLETGKEFKMGNPPSGVIVTQGPMSCNSSDVSRVIKV